MRKGVNWKEFSGNRGEREEGEKRQLLIESEFEETQKKGEKSGRKRENCPGNRKEAVPIQ